MDEPKHEYHQLINRSGLRWWWEVRTWHDGWGLLRTESGFTWTLRKAEAAARQRIRAHEDWLRGAQIKPL